MRLGWNGNEFVLTSPEGTNAFDCWFSRFYGELSLVVVRVAPLAAEVVGADWGFAA